MDTVILGRWQFKMTTVYRFIRTAHHWPIVSGVGPEQKIRRFHRLRRLFWSKDSVVSGYKILLLTVLSAGAGGS
jgi:hypothetical protein